MKKIVGLAITLCYVVIKWTLYELDNYALKLI